MWFGSRRHGFLIVPAALVALGTGASYAAEVAVTGPSSATPGGTVTLAVSLSPDLDAVYAIQGALAYDPAVLTPLESEGVVPQGFHEGDAEPFPGETIPKDADLFRMNASAPGQVVFGYVKNPSNPAGSPSAAMPHEALRVTFSVAPGASGQTSVSLAPYSVNGQSLPAVLVGSVNGAPLEAAVGGPHTLALVLRGDADGSGDVTMNDVLLALQAAGGLPEGEGAALRVPNADVWPAGAPDGQVTLEDALRIGRFLAGLETDLN